jgi:hypothetical protein
MKLLWIGQFLWDIFRFVGPIAAIEVSSFSSSFKSSKVSLTI